MSDSASGPDAGTYQLVNDRDGTCLTDPSSGTRLGGAACDGEAGQTWQLAESGEGFRVKSASGGLCVDVKSASKSGGTAVQQQTCGDGTSQVWKATEVGETYHLVNANSGKCLNLVDALAQQDSCDAASSKSWRLNAVSDVAPTPTTSRSSASPSASPSPSGSPSASPSKRATPKASATRPRTPSQGAALGAWPNAPAGEPVSATIEVSVSYDGGMKRYSGSGALGGGGQGEDQDALFELADGAVLKNVILGAPAADGIHCLGSCTLQNVWWEDVGEDAATFKGTSASARYAIDGGGARYADDKVFQHNGAGTVTIKNFQVEDFGKLYRSCGNCDTQYERHVIVSNVRATDGGQSLVGVNANYGDTAELSGITVVGGEIDICERFQGNESGDEPTKLGSGADGTHCRYSSSSIKYQ
ncbi:pectate lyase [Streptomyces sp. YC419]|uniref:pectate lyase n=1 Tax=Streptomyces ureilyticus TaxID=1775131 RepID=A0ABX0DYA4_9ACTN|nr:pectate lyase [Streptomyces ureilyticus]